jgi:hypothetical protein
MRMLVFYVGFRALEMVVAPMAIKGIYNNGHWTA